MDHVEPSDVAQSYEQPRAFTVLIPRALQPTVNALPSEVRQRVLAELFRLASQTTQERAGQSHGFTYAMRMEIADCAVTVEMDDPRSRLMLTGLTWQPPSHH
ncbi:hypothetical protein [Hyalangium minutum]|uniref:Uncharacterized protein n=1 Tax=Hyalangium minutum TaxID=394096 RepID=A0A085WLG0_9BACT|nr:hypothetical protein [Hyalangium minutum]KFE68523.1 hypothetical protein DB31_7760 [Hyalangium minutum]